MVQALSKSCEMQTLGAVLQALVARNGIRSRSFVSIDWRMIFSGRLDQNAKLLLCTRADVRMDQPWLNSILYLAYEAGKVRLRLQLSPAAGIL